MLPLFCLVCREISWHLEERRGIEKNPWFQGTRLSKGSFVSRGFFQPIHLLKDPKTVGAIMKFEKSSTLEWLFNPETGICL